MDAVAQLAVRLTSRGWNDLSDVDGLAWDWPGTALPPENSGNGVLPCTSIFLAVDGDEVDSLAVQLVLVGEPDVSETGGHVAPTRLTDESLDQLEAYRPAGPVPAVATARVPSHRQA